jgi:hypothetical protein
MAYEREVFVFGSNREGRHGKGAALEARARHGAIYGQAEGLQGNSYAIVTKELRSKGQRNGAGIVTLNEVAAGVDIFLEFAEAHPNWRFNVTPIGCGLAGFKPYQIAPLFRGHTPNVVLPEEFFSGSGGPKRQSEDD